MSTVEPSVLARPLPQGVLTRTLTKESKVLGRELTQIRENSRQQVRGQTIPCGQRCAVLIEGCRRYPTSAIATIIVGAVKRQRWIGAIECSAQHRAAHDEGMAAPSVIRPDSSGSRAGRLEGAPEIRKRKQRHDVAVSLESHLVIEGARGLTELRQQISLSARAVRHRGINGSLVRVRIESAERTKEYLPVHAESAT